MLAAIAGEDFELEVSGSGFRIDARFAPAEELLEVAQEMVLACRDGPEAGRWRGPDLRGPLQLRA